MRMLKPTPTPDFLPRTLPDPGLRHISQTFQKFIVIECPEKNLGVPSMEPYCEKK